MYNFLPLFLLLLETYVKLSAWKWQLLFHYCIFGCFHIIKCFSCQGSFVSVGNRSHGDPYLVSREAVAVLLVNFYVWLKTTVRSQTEWTGALLRWILHIQNSDF
jgi:hypothetical protein